MAYQVTFTLNALYTGSTEADNFTIIGQHSNGSPADTTIATSVTKAQLTAGVTYQVADTITGGTVTSTGDCDNSVNWTGLNNGGGDEPSPSPTPTERVGDEPGEGANFIFNRCTVDGEAPESVIIAENDWNLNSQSALPLSGQSTITLDSQFISKSTVFVFDTTTQSASTHSIYNVGGNCQNT